MDSLSLSETMTVRATRPQRLVMKLSRQSAADWRDLIAAQAALLMAQVQVWTRPVGRFVEDVQRVAPGLQAPISRNSREWGEALRIARAVRRVADNGLMKPKCLVRAVAINRVLESRGIKGSRVRIGVRRIDGNFSAHAWVELGQRLLGDDPRHVSTFAQLLDVKVLDNATKRSLSA